MVIIIATTKYLFCKKKKKKLINKVKDSFFPTDQSQKILSDISNTKNKFLLIINRKKSKEENVKTALINIGYSSLPLLLLLLHSSSPLKLSDHCHCHHYQDSFYSITPLLSTGQRGKKKRIKDAQKLYFSFLLTLYKE